MKPSKRNILWLVPLLLIAALFYYFKPNDNGEKFIAYAEDAVLVSNSTYTFKETFNQYCEKGEWTYFETSKRKDVVEFKGECQVDNKVQPFNLQLLLNDDLTEFTIGAMLVNHEQQDEAEKQQLLEMIYAAYTP